MPRTEFTYIEFARVLFEDQSQSVRQSHEMADRGAQFGIWLGGIATGSIALLVSGMEQLNPWIGRVPVKFSIALFLLTVFKVVLNRKAYLEYSARSWAHHQWFLGQLKAIVAGSIEMPPELTDSADEDLLVRSLNTHFDISPESIAPMRGNKEALLFLYRNLAEHWYRSNRDGIAHIQRLTNALAGHSVTSPSTPTKTAEEQTRADLTNRAAEAKAIQKDARDLERDEMHAMYYFLAGVIVLCLAVAFAGSPT